jgi:predicted RNase H-like nuclease (RuvC/YqgF family)
VLRRNKMFETFKKPDEEPTNETQNNAEPTENPEQKCKKENQSEEANPQVTFENTEESVLSTLEALGGEERLLLSEKSQLLDMEETLRQRIKDEIEVKRHRIENLKYEIPELKQRCEALAKALDIPVQK